LRISEVDSKKLLPLLDELTKAIEELLLTGLTTASEATRQTLNVSFQEASRLRLLRLGGTLRVACEELSRYTKNQADFSRKRFSFFLNRAWILSRGLSKALQEGNEAEFERLSWTPASAPVSKLKVVTLGVSKKVVPSAFCAFEFRLRSIDTADGGIPLGTRLIWSVIFPVKPDSEIPPEGYLHLPQKQKFNASCFLEGKSVVIENATVSFEKSGAGRISLGEQSTVGQDEEFVEWGRFLTWESDTALERLRCHQPGPLDLDVELQEEVIFDEWEIGAPDDQGSEAQIIYPITHKDMVFDAVIPRGVDGNCLQEAFANLGKKKSRPPLFGLLHYERCRLIVQPLSVLNDNGPDHLMISKAKIDRSSLLKALKF
jgi:hypothetical protein